MLHTTLYHYLRKECDTVTAAYNTLQQAPGDADAIHAMRVGVKKLRAFFSLVTQLPDYSFGAGKHLKEARLIQSIGGASRDTHLQEKHLRAYEKKVDWRFSFAHLLLQNKAATADEMMEATVKFSSLKKLGTLPERFKAAIADIDPDAATPALIGFLKQQHEQIIIPSSRAHHTVWHGVRKKVKALYYHLNILEQLLPATFTVHLLPPAREAGELLGQWHDTSELLLFVKATVAQLKKEKITLPVNAQQLVQLLDTDRKEQLAQCARQVKVLAASL
ncbi:CHAD domain-containing protein [Chitinophaga arvensicola]|uniref:CHAD domain-containing protein n=1 Tax=Chitinophaga arvensicola TaxID=29529 RepID=A0A1I0R1J4_9BACT|nr:CHAD domain-containing protein [Chitinophaga arvensicola]SEW34304.1 CHAD domain-containing protein [Chitinophaga arvensicola]